MKRVLMGLLAVVVVAAAVGIAAVRMTSHEAARWHVDPLATERTGKPNDVLLAPEGMAAAQTDGAAPVYAVGPEALVQAVDEMATAQPRTKVVARGPSADLMTYVQRSALVGFPDYVTFKVIKLGDDRSTFAVWSRSRFGYSDMGVNKERVSAWIDAIDAPRAE